LFGLFSLAIICLLLFVFILLVSFKLSVALFLYEHDEIKCIIIPVIPGSLELKKKCFRN